MLALGPSWSPWRECGVLGKPTEPPQPQQHLHCWVETVSTSIIAVVFIFVPNSIRELGAGAGAAEQTHSNKEAPNYDSIVNRYEITNAAASAFANSEQIPEKYVRTEEVLDGVVVGEDERYELPVVDMARLLAPEMSASEIARLGDACRNWGFFQLTNHGVDEEVVQRMKDNTVQFFSLPLESKAKVAVRGNGFEGFGHHYSKASSGKLDWAESMILVTQPPQDRNMEMWPTNPPTFRDALEVYSVEMIDLAMRLLGLMAADLGVEQEVLRDAFTGKRQSMAIHYYPPCRHREKVMGITPHTDGLGLTLLLHVDDTPGLQIRKDGRWFPVRPLPGALVVNVADILDVLTNGAYARVEHRVLPDAERGRTTVVIFQEASVGGMVAPLPGLLEKEGGAHARYRSIEIEEYIKGNFNALEQGTRFIESLRI